MKDVVLKFRRENRKGEKEEARKKEKGLYSECDHR